MKKILLHKALNYLIFVLFFTVIEAFSFYVMYKDLPTFFFLDIIIALFLGSLIFFIKYSTFDFIYLPLALVAFSVLQIVNTNYYLIFGDIFSVQYLSIVGKGLSVIDSDYINYGHMAVVIFINVIFILIMVVVKLLVRSKGGKTKYSYKGAIITASLLVSCIGSYVLGLNLVIDHELKNNNKSILNVTIAKPSNYLTLGSISYYIKEIQTIKGNGFTNQDIEDYFSTPKVSDSEFTGALKGYNILNIMVETGAYYMQNKTLMPNLTELLDNGINMTNSYFKNKTNVSEIISILGSYSTEGLNTSKNDYVFPYSLPNMLDSNYQTFFLHDVDASKDIYNRRGFLKNLGFDEVYLGETLSPLGPSWDWSGNYRLDSVTAKKVSEIIVSKKDQPFFAHWTTLSMHGPYYRNPLYDTYSSLYYQRLKEAESAGLWVNPLSHLVDGNRECMEVYMMKCMDFDVGLGELIKSLKENDIYENTIINIFGDHEIYYNGATGKSLTTILSNNDGLNYYDNYKITMAISNPTLKSLYLKKYKTDSNEFSDFATPFSIVPTTLDLLGIKYNSNFYIGYSIFSPEYRKTKIAYSYELSSFYNMDFWSIDGSTIYDTFNEKASPLLFLSSLDEVFDKQFYLNNIYRDNTFSEKDFKDYNYR